MAKLLWRFRISIAFTVCLAVMLTGCVIAHDPAPLLFQLNFEPLTDRVFTEYEVEYFLERKETDPSTGITSFVQKLHNVIRMPTGSPSRYTWDTFRSPYEGGVWRCRARVSARRPGSDANVRPLYIGEGVQETSTPHEPPPRGTSITRQFNFRLEANPAAANDYRVVAAP